MIKLSNIFKTGLKGDKGKEIVTSLLTSADARAEIVTSFNAASPRNFWYDQTENEFVAVLKGSALLNMEGNIVKMKKGDYIIIPPHQKHRVEKTSSKCVWLCIYYK